MIQIVRAISKYDLYTQAPIAIIYIYRVGHFNPSTGISPQVGAIAKMPQTKVIWLEGDHKMVSLV